MGVESKLKLLSDKKADLKMVSDLWGGTQAMRDAGKEWLPQEPGEENEDYKNRKSRSFLTNFFKKTVNGFAGRLFEDPVTIEANDEFADLFAENVDMEGRDFHRFGYDLSRFSLRDGLRFILIDAPVAEGVKTKADELAAGIRSYFVELDIRNVLGWKIKGGAFSQFRYKEVVTEAGDDEFSEKDVDQIRVIEPDLVRLYRRNNKGKWVKYLEIITSISYVPVVPVFGDRQGLMSFTPPLLDIAWLNVEHWQKSSDQSNILHVARVPILHWAGYKPSFDAQGNDVTLDIGPNTLAKSTDPSARLEYVEHSGAGIGAGRDDLMDIEARAISLGAEFVSPQKAGNKTATEKAIDESGDISELSAFALNLKDSLTIACRMAWDMMGKKFVGKVNINTDLGVMSTPVNVAELVKLRQSGDISREGMYEILNNEWGTTLDSVEEMERLDMEGPSFGGGLDG